MVSVCGRCELAARPFDAGPLWRDLAEARDINQPVITRARDSTADADACRQNLQLSRSSKKWLYFTPTLRETYLDTLIQKMDTELKIAKNNKWLIYFTFIINNFCCKSQRESRKEMKEYKEGDKRKRYDGRQKKKEKVKVVD